MNLDDAQKKIVSQWITEGLKVSEIQNRLEKELGVRMTYMEVRFLLDDLQLMPKDQPTSQTDNQIGPAGESGKNRSAAAPGTSSPVAPSGSQESLPKVGKVSVTTDAITKPGALVSGSVTFSDGQSAAWYLDQLGRLGLSPKQEGYRPSPEDLEDFQLELQTQLQKLGF